jgi:hypothetical protein
VKRIWYLSSIAAAMVFGILVGERLKPPAATMDVLVSEQGKVFPAPKNGDTLNWVGSDLKTQATIHWDPQPGQPFHTPCEDDKDSGTTCTIKFKTNVKNFAYHYKCDHCGDPIIPGRPSTGRPPSLGDRKVGPDGNIYSAVAAFNDATKLSGVYYFAPDSATVSGFNAISVSTYIDSTKNDKIVFETPFDESHWSLSKLLTGTCNEQKGDGGIGDKGSSTCTIQSSAKTQYYCVTYDDKSPGPAGLVVNGVPLPPTTPKC